MTGGDIAGGMLRALVVHLDLLAHAGKGRCTLLTCACSKTACICSSLLHCSVQGVRGEVNSRITPKSTKPGGRNMTTMRVYSPSVSANEAYPSTRPLEGLRTPWGATSSQLNAVLPALRMWRTERAVSSICSSQYPPGGSDTYGRETAPLPVLYWRTDLEPFRFEGKVTLHQHRPPMFQDSLSTPNRHIDGRLGHITIQSCMLTSSQNTLRHLLSRR